jgi:hypothetical protein
LPAGLVRANCHNVLGYWESTDVVNINDEILQFLGVRHNDGAGLGRICDERLSERVALRYTDVLATIIKRNLSNTPLVLKDPRLSLLLRHWLRACEILAVKPVTIMAFRWPDDVASSISERDGVDRLSAKRSWLQFTLLAERQSREYPRWFVAYEKLLDNWRLQMEEIRTRLKINLTLQSGRDVDTFLRRSLRHHSHSHTGGDRFGDMCVDVYNHLVRITTLTEVGGRPFDKTFDKYFMALEKSWNDAPSYQDRRDGPRLP